MFRSPSYNSFLYRDNRRRSDQTNDQYNQLEDLASEFSLIRKEIYNDSEHERLLHLSQQVNEVKSKNMYSRQQEISNRHMSLKIPLRQPVKGNHIKPDSRSERKSLGMNKNSLIPRVHRLAGLSCQLRSFSERVLAKDNSDVSISNMSGATELTVPSCASWDVPYGSFHCVIAQVSDDSTSLSTSMETSEDDSQESKTQSGQVPLVWRSVHATKESKRDSETDVDTARAPLEGSSSIRADLLMEENSLLWGSSGINAPIIKQVAVNVENCTTPKDVANAHIPELTLSNFQVLHSSMKEGICLSECHTAAGNPVTVLATPTIVQSVEGPTRTLEVFQLQCFPIVQNVASPGNVLSSTLDDESQHSSRDFDSMVTNQQSLAINSNLSKPPRHPLTKAVAKDIQDHRETIMAGFSERTLKPKKNKKSKVSVAEIEALLNRENQENQENGGNHNQVRFQSIPSLHENRATSKKSKHRRVHSYDTAKISNVTSMMDGPRKVLPQTFLKFQNSHDIFREHPTSLVASTVKPDPQHQQVPNNGFGTNPDEPQDTTERRSEQSTTRSKSRRRRSHSSGNRSSRSLRSWAISDEQNEPTVMLETTRKEEKIRSDHSTSRDSLDSDSLSIATSQSRRGEPKSSRSKDCSLARANKSTCTNICGILEDTWDDVESMEDVDMVLREIRKQQIDRRIAERVGAMPLGISMAEERLLQRIRDRSKQGGSHDDDGSSSPSEADKAWDVASYRSRRHGRTMVNSLKLKRDVTPTRRMEQKDMDHSERRRFLEDFRNEISSMEKREKRRRSTSRSIERRRQESRSHKGEETCSETTSRSSSPLSRRSCHKE